MKKTLITSKNRNYDIISDDEAVNTWFDNPQVTMTDIILRQINTERLYDSVLSDKNDLVIIDCGANVGLFSLYAQDSAKLILALEPTPATSYVLNELVKDIDKIKPLQIAASCAKETIPFYINDNPTCNSIVNQTGTRIDVQGMTWLDVMNENGLDHVDFVKCDIEGSEMIALTDETLGAVSDKIDAWFIEVHQTNVTETHWPGNLEDNRQELAKLFQRHGYQTQLIINDQLYAWKIR